MAEEYMTTERRMELYAYGLRQMLPEGTSVNIGEGYIGVGDSRPDMKGIPRYPVKLVDKDSSGHGQFAIYQEVLDKDAQPVQFEAGRSQSPGSALYATVVIYERKH